MEKGFDVMINPSETAQGLSLLSQEKDVVTHVL